MYGGFGVCGAKKGSRMERQVVVRAYLFSRLVNGKGEGVRRTRLGHSAAWST